MAGPGTGKSALALTYVIKSGLSALYFSPDSGSFTQVQRSYSIATGEDMAQAEKFALSQSTENLDLVTKLPVRFDFAANPSLTDIERNMEAYEELFGEYPAVTIVDNITNVRSGLQDNDNDPFSGLEGLLDWLHTLGRDTSSCVIGLHHVNGPWSDGDKPIPLSGVKGQIHRVPEIVLTVFRSGPERIGVSVVKNRGAFADPSGETYAELVFDGDTMTIADPEMSSEPPFPTPEGENTGEADSSSENRSEEVGF